MGTLNLRTRIKALIPDSLLDVARIVFRGGVALSGPVSYNQDGLAVQHNAPFLHDERFLHAYRVGKETGSWGAANVQWRVHVACWAADQTKHLRGDFIEFGVNRGGLAAAVMDYVSFSNLGKRYYLLDTFNGLDDSLISEPERLVGRTADAYYSECYDEVMQRFGGDPFVTVVRGSVPSTLDQVDAVEFCFVSMDMNCAAPELAALEFCWPKLVPGGVIVLDDYGFRTHEAQQCVHINFARDRGVALLELPTGQGLIMKPL